MSASRSTHQDPSPKPHADVRSILMLHDVRTGESREIHRFDFLMEAPSFRSPDEMIFNAKGRILSFRPSSARLMEIDTGYCTRCNNDHVLSPDGTKLAVSHHTVDDNASRIHIIDLMESHPPFLVTPLAPSYLHGWSPDGSTLSYTAERNGEWDIYTIPVTGGMERRLTFTPVLEDGPEYSPDGRRILFNAVRNDRMDCYSMDTDGSGWFRLTDNGRNNWFPHVSPDGTRVAYLSFDATEVAPGDHPANKHVEIRTIRPDGSEDVVACRFFGGQGSINVNSWMPDGLRFAFVKYEFLA